MDEVVELIGGGSVINRAYLVYYYTTKELRPIEYFFLVLGL